MKTQGSKGFFQFGTMPPVPMRALPFVSYDIYEDTQKRQQYHFDGSVALADYQREAPFSVKPLAVVSTNPNNPYPVPTPVGLPGEKYRGKWSQTQVATGNGQDFIRSLLENMHQLEQMGECLEPFTSENTRVRDGKCVLYNVTRIPLDLKKLEANYISCQQIATDAFHVHGPLPEDIEHLLTMMGSEFENRSMFRFHTSLWSLSDRAGRFMHMHDVLMSLPKGYRDHVYETIGKQPCIADWRTEARKNELLESIYVHATTDYTMQKGGNLQISEGARFINYLRNISYHRMDDYHKMKKGNEYSAEGAELVALLRWSKAYALVQYELFKISVQRTVKDLSRGFIY